MRFTFIHQSSPFEHQLQHRGWYLYLRVDSLADWRKKTGGGPEDWPTTETELEAAGLKEGMKDVMALQETEQMTETEKQLMEAAIADGLKELKTRFRYNPAVPEVPEDFYEKANASLPEECRGPYGYTDLEMDYWLDYYPFLDKVTVNALLQESDSDLFPNFGMLAFGAHFFSQSWTDEELQQWCEGMKGLGGTCVNKPPKSRILRKLTPTKRANLLAELTGDVMNYSMQCVQMGNLEHTVEHFTLLSLNELLVEADQAGIDIADRDDKAAVVLAVVEHIYSDVIEPTVTA